MKQKRENKKKEKHREKKKKMEKHISSESSASSDSEWQEPGLFNSLFSKTTHCGPRWGPVGEGGVREQEERETPRGRACGVPGAGSHLPSRGDASWVLPGSGPGQPDSRLESFPRAPPADLCGPRLLRSASGRATRWGESLRAPPGAAEGSASRVGLLTPGELRPDFPLVLR